MVPGVVDVSVVVMAEVCLVSSVWVRQSVDPASSSAGLHLVVGGVEWLPWSLGCVGWVI